MPTIDELRNRSAMLFADLLAPRARAAEVAAPGDVAAEPERTFRWFDPDDAAEAVALAGQLAIVSGAAESEEEGSNRPWTSPRPGASRRPSARDDERGNATGGSTSSTAVRPIHQVRQAADDSRDVNH